MLVNPGFEEMWGGSRRCVVVRMDGSIVVVDIGNVQCPKGWAVWLADAPPTFVQPEGRMAASTSPDRMKSGLNGYVLFNTFAGHDSGLLQKVEVGAGSLVFFSGYAHAWSNHCDPDEPGEYPHPDDPRWSEGAGYELYYERTNPESPVENDRLRNFTFFLGIDPQGGIDPFAPSVAWGDGAHIYNGYREVPPVSAVAEVDEITVFARNMAIWPYKHNDAYWDDFELVVIEPDPPVTFKKVVRLVPQDATKEEYDKVKSATYRLKQDLTFSVDSAFARGPAISDLLVYAYEPKRMGGRRALEKYVEISHPPVPEIKYRKLTVEEPEPPPPSPTPKPKPNCVISLHQQTDESGIQNYLGRVQPEWIKVVNGIEDAAKYKAWGAQNVDVRIPVANSKQYIDSMDIEGYLANFDQALERNIEHIDAFEDLNEEWPNDPQVLEFLIRMSNEAKRRYGSDLKLCSGNWAVGNGEGAWLLEWARVIAANEHLAGYHCYHPVSPLWAEEWMEQEAEWYHLRHLYHIDPYLTANGVYVDWLGTEAGAVEGKPLEGPGMTGTHAFTMGPAPRVARLSDEFMTAKAIERMALDAAPSLPDQEGFMRALADNVGPLDPTGGWRDEQALNGDLDRYIQLQSRLADKIGMWNAVNGNRMRGTCIFTVGAAFVGWKQYKLWEPDMDAFAEAFAA